MYVHIPARVFEKGLTKKKHTLLEKVPDTEQEFLIHTYHKLIQKL